MASSLGSVLYKQWAKRVFAIECGSSSEPLYFALSPSAEGPWDERCRLHRLLSRAATYSLSVASDSRVRGAEAYVRLQSELARLPDRCRVLEMTAFFPNEEGSSIKGFLVQDEGGCPTTERVLRDLARESGQTCLCTYWRGAEGRMWQSLGRHSEGSRGEILNNCLALAEKPQLHPSVLNIKNSVVFSKYEEACAVFQECAELFPEAKEVLQIVAQYNGTYKKGRFPVIVIEGLDATGKSTLTESLRASIQATLLKSPHDCIGHLRKAFDVKLPLIRRAFYTLGNYITASAIASASETSPVIVDRFWHSTAAYAIATEVSGKVDNLPPPHHELYQWPQDLLQPDLVLLLTVSADERIRRLEQRAEMKTKEEAELEINSLFRQKVEATYRRMEKPACVVVDASASKEEVLKTALLIIEKYCGIKKT